jgi:beta-phosphoglucomutase
MDKIRGIIFDLDGVLVDAKEWHYEALNKALETCGCMITRDEHLNQYDGLPTRTKLEMLTKTKGLPKDKHGDIYNLKQEYTMSIAEDMCQPNKEHLYALARLRREGYHLAVASNAIRKSVAVLLTKSELIHFVEFFLSNQDVSKPKPDPEIYDSAIQRLGLLPSQCLVVEDNINGITSAKAAGAHLLEVDTVHDVTYDNIINRINNLA